MQSAPASSYLSRRRNGPCNKVPRCATADALHLHAGCATHEPALVAHGAVGQLVRCCAPGQPLPTSSAAPVRITAEAGIHPVAASLSAVRKHYALGRLSVRSVDSVDLEIRQGEALGLVGESGCGKSTLARLLLRTSETTGGDIRVFGHDLARPGRSDLRRLRRDVQMVFQNPVAALDPRMRLGDSLMAALDHNQIGIAGDRRPAVLRTMSEVGLPASFFDRLPRQCSGGQLQRAVIARALLMQPKLLVCDEPTSALDASIRAQILNLLRQLRVNDPELTIIMITHDLRVLRHVCDRVAVMYLGEIVEIADTETLFERPAHPYTQALIASSLLETHGLGCSMAHVRGETPSPLVPISGCRFHARCSLATDQCVQEHPTLAEIEDETGHTARCWHWRAAQKQAIATHVVSAPAFMANTGL